MAPPIDYQLGRPSKKSGAKGQKRFERRRKSAEKHKTMEGIAKNPNIPEPLVDNDTASAMGCSPMQKSQAIAAARWDTWGRPKPTSSGVNNWAARTQSAGSWDTWGNLNISSDNPNIWGSSPASTPSGSNARSSSNPTSVSSNSCGEEREVVCRVKVKGIHTQNGTTRSASANKKKTEPRAKSNAWPKFRGQSAVQALFPEVSKKELQNSEPENEVRQVKNWDDDGPALWQPYIESHPDGTRFPPETQEARERRMTKAEVDRELEHWPLMDDPTKMKTLAPFLESGHPYKSPQDLQPEATLIHKLLANEVIKDGLFRLIFRNWGSIAAFSSSCQLISSIIATSIHHWDVTNGFFQNCELPMKSGKELIKDPNVKQGSVRSILVVTQVRALDQSLSYAKQAKSLFQTSLAINNFCQYIRICQLHRVPLLTVNVLALWIPVMTKLEFLGIYNCPLLHFGDTSRILDILPRDRPKGHEKQITLDFYPMYHRGPPNSFGEYYTGSYAVTWDNSGIPTDLAIRVMLRRIMRQAKKQGFDIVAEGTAFRKWLENSPCQEVAKTIEVFRDPKSTPEVIAAYLDYRKFQGKIHRLKQTVDKPGYSTWATDLLRCPTCKVSQEAISYYWGGIRAHRYHGDGPPNCWGCQLDWYLRNETDHYKRQKRGIIIEWLKLPKPPGRDFAPGERRFNDDDLGKALRDFVSNQNIMAKAHLLDKLRASHIADTHTGHKEYDHELEERQKPIPLEELNHKMNTYISSPTVNSLDANLDGWNWAPLDRYDGHGMAWR